MEPGLPRLVTQAESEGPVADDKIKLTTTEARGGSRGTQVRTVMIIGLGLVIVAFAIIYAIYG